MFVETFTFPIVLTVIFPDITAKGFDVNVAVVTSPVKLALSVIS